MSWRIVDKWEEPCEKCGQTREVAKIQHDLGSTAISILRWCACPTGELVAPVPKS